MQPVTPWCLKNLPENLAQPNHPTCMQRTRDLRKKGGTAPQVHENPISPYQTAFYSTQNNLGLARQLRWKFCSSMIESVGSSCGAKAL